MLPAAAVVATFLAPRFQLAGFGPASGLLAGLLPIITGALLGLGYLFGRPKFAPSHVSVARTAGVERLFWLVVLILVVPTLILEKVPGSTLNANVQVALKTKGRGTALPGARALARLDLRGNWGLNTEDGAVAKGP